jgi:hypothetical protein
MAEHAPPPVEELNLKAPPFQRLRKSDFMVIQRCNVPSHILHVDNETCLELARQLQCCLDQVGFEPFLPMPDTKFAGQYMLFYQGLSESQREVAVPPVMMNKMAYARIARFGEHSSQACQEFERQLETYGAPFIIARCSKCQDGQAMTPQKPDCGLRLQKH